MKIIQNNDFIIAVIIMLLLVLGSIFKFCYGKADHKLHHNISVSAYFNICYTGSYLKEKNCSLHN